MLSGFCPAWPFWSNILQCRARLQIHTQNYWTALSVGPIFAVRVCLSVTLLFIDMRQYCVCCIRSGVIRFWRFMVLYLCRVWQCGLHTVLWSHISILLGLLAAEPRSTAELLFHSQCLCRAILLTLYSIVWEWRVKSRANAFLLS